MALDLLLSSQHRPAPAALRMASRTAKTDRKRSLTRRCWKRCTCCLNGIKCDLDPVDGLWRPGPQRNPTWTFDLWESLTPLMDFKHVPLTETLLSWGLDRQWPEIQPWLERAFMDVKLPDSLRARALAGLIDFDAESQAAWLQRGLRDDADAVRSVALKVYEKTSRGSSGNLTSGGDPESTMAIRRLALQSMWRLSGDQPQKLRTQWWQQFLEGEFPPHYGWNCWNWCSPVIKLTLAWWQHYRQKVKSRRSGCPQRPSLRAVTLRQAETCSSTVLKLPVCVVIKLKGKEAWWGPP